MKNILKCTYQITGFRFEEERKSHISAKVRHFTYLLKKSFRLVSALKSSILIHIVGYGS